MGNAEEVSGEIVDPLLYDPQDDGKENLLDDQAVAEMKSKQVENSKDRQGEGSGKISGRYTLFFLIRIEFIRITEAHFS